MGGEMTLGEQQRLWRKTGRRLFHIHMKIPRCDVKQLNWMFKCQAVHSNQL